MVHLPRGLTGSLLNLDSSYFQLGFDPHISDQEFTALLQNPTYLTGKWSPMWVPILWQDRKVEGPGIFEVEAFVGVSCGLFPPVMWH